MPAALRTTSIDAILRASKEAIMRTTLALDDDLVREAQHFTGLQEKSALVREALKALIERESARRLARLGGSEPDLTVAPRRRSEPV
jgi:Arc/MetJ family transcription regulator